MEDGKAYIYSLNCPIDNIPKYVGQTCKKISKRLTNHIAESARQRNKRTNWIKSLTNKGLRPTIEVIDIVDIKDISFWEKHYISLYKSWGFDLKNSTDGGELNATPSQEVKKKIGIANKGRICSEETRRKLSLAGKGIKRTPEQRLNYSRAQLGNKKWLGKKHTEEWKRQSSLRQIGHIVSAETRKKISEAKKGTRPWNKKN